MTKRVWDKKVYEPGWLDPASGRPNLPNEPPALPNQVERTPEMKNIGHKLFVFLAVHNSSIGDLVTH